MYLWGIDLPSHTRCAYLGREHYAKLFSSGYTNVLCHQQHTRLHIPWCTKIVIFKVWFVGTWHLLTCFQKGSWSQTIVIMSTRSLSFSLSWHLYWWYKWVKLLKWRQWHQTILLVIAFFTIMSYKGEKERKASFTYECLWWSHFSNWFY